MLKLGLGLGIDVGRYIARTVARREQDGDVVVMSVSATTPAVTREQDGDVRVG